jgi:SulP family sulfate permease
MLGVIMFAYRAIGLIPIGTLTGALYMVVVNTFYFRSIVLILKRQIPPLDSLIILVVTILSIFTNLAVGVIVGVLINALSYTYHSSA